MISKMKIISFNNILNNKYNNLDKRYNKLDKIMNKIFKSLEILVINKYKIFNRINKILNKFRIKYMRLVK